MPTYEYQCDVCESVFEEFQSIKAQPFRKADCEKCGKRTKVRRLIGTGGAVIFKGSGFYQTDYRSESYKKSAEADAGAGKKTDGGKAGKSGDTKKTESKSKSKSDSKSTTSTKSDTK